MVSGSNVTEKQFIVLCQIKTKDDRISSAMENMTGDITMENLTKALKLCDKHASEYMSEYRNLVKSPMESYQAFAQRLRSTYCRGVEAKENTLTDGENRILVEVFLNSLNPSSADIIRIVADESELSSLSKIAERASRMPKSQSVNVILENAEPESLNESDENLSLLDIVNIK